MQILINNKTTLPNKYIRLAKWKVHNLKERFKDLLYTEIFIKEEGNKPTSYLINIRLGIPGYDLIIKDKSENIDQLLHQSIKKAQRLLADNRAKVLRQN